MPDGKAPAPSATLRAGDPKIVTAVVFLATSTPHHYSYAARGVPVIFSTTGLHPDYHANTDEVSEIEFVKMTRIVQLIYETGARVANLDHAPRRGNLGPRGGKDTRE